MNISIKKDLYRYVGDKCQRRLTQWRYILFTPGFTYIWAFRHVQLAKNPISRFFWAVIRLHLSFRFGIQIPCNTTIGEGFRILHYGTIVVNPQSVIGKNFNISQGTLIGCAQGKRKGAPVIGNNVCMHANSIIIGGVHIGDNVLIAPGTFINFDVPDNSIVIGNPGRIVDRRGGVSPTDKYIVYHVENFKE